MQKSIIHVIYLFTYFLLIFHSHLNRFSMHCISLPLSHLWGFFLIELLDPAHHLLSLCPQYFYWLMFDSHSHHKFSVCSHISNTHHMISVIPFLFSQLTILFFCFVNFAFHSTCMIRTECIMFILSPPISDTHTHGKACTQHYTIRSVTPFIYAT